MKGYGICVLSALAMVRAKFEDPWFQQFPQTDSYLASDGWSVRLPLRLQSHETILYGTADLAAMLADFEEELFTPITVGGKVPLQLWFNNFTDTDCGDPKIRNPYLETWFSLPVTPKESPIALPYESDMSLIVSDPRALVWVHRVICGDAPGHRGPAMSAISGGREVFGFPKHQHEAQIRYEYIGNSSLSFAAVHDGSVAVQLDMRLPEANPKAVTVPLDAKTGPSTCISGPRWAVKQTRYGQAFKCTQHIAPWDAATDRLTVGNDAWYGATLARLNFVPKLKVHSTDFKIAAFKPAGWGKSERLVHV